MRTALRIFLLAIGLAASLSAAAARAGELIEFPNLPEQTPAQLRGYLARPDTGLSALLGSRSNRARPYSAVVVLHAAMASPATPQKSLISWARGGMWR
jgi:hypothetical protein